MALNNASAFWNFDSSLTDSSGNGITLSAVGSPDYTTGILGNALRSPTTSDSAQRTGVIIAAGSFSMGGWFFASSLKNFLYQKGNTGTGQQILTGFSGFQFTVDDGANTVGNAGLTFPNWFHVVGTYNSSTQTLILYVNGAQVDTNTFAAVYPTGTVTIIVLGGGSNSLADLCFFYPFVLTPSEVSQLYNGGAGYNPYEGPYYVAMAQTHCAGAVGSQVHNAGAVGGQHHVAGAVAGMIGGQP